MTDTDTRLNDRLHPTSAVLAVIDVQNDFCHRDGKVASAGLDVSTVASAVERLAALVFAARQSGVPVIFVRTEHDGEVDSATWRQRFEGGRDLGDADPGVNCHTGSWGAEFFGVEPRTDEPVVIKHRYSAFSSPGFAAVLDRLGRASILFAGVATHICVEGTLRDAVDNDLLATVVSDCCAAYHQDDHAAAIRRINSSFGPAVESTQVISEWRTLAATIEGA